MKVIIFAILGVVAAIISGHGFGKKQWVSAISFSALSIIWIALIVINEFQVDKKIGMPAEENNLIINEVYETVKTIPYEKNTLVVAVDRYGETRVYWMATEPPKTFKVVKPGEYKPYP